MQILMIDSASPPDAATLRKLQLRGYEVVTASTKHEAMDWIGRTQFDYILVAVPSSATDDFRDLSEIRRLARISSVVLMTTGTTSPLIEDAVTNGSIELAHESSLITKLEALSKPVLLACSQLSPALIHAMRSEGLEVHVASTLQFAVDLFVDRRGHIIILKFDVPGMRDETDWAICHRIDLRTLTILAAASRDILSAIVHCTKPQKAIEFIELFEYIAATCPSPCGFAEHFRNPGTAETKAS